jgi:hypothetical protein
MQVRLLQVLDRSHQGRSGRRFGNLRERQNSSFLTFAARCPVNCLYRPGGSGGHALLVLFKNEHSNYLAAFFGYPALGACRSQ